MVVAALSGVEQEKAVAAFEALGVCRQLADAAAGLGWKSPSSIQVQAIPHLLQGTLHYESLLWQMLPADQTHEMHGADRDIIGLAQTGSGKTGAFALPILEVSLPLCCLLTGQSHQHTNLPQLTCATP